MYWQYVTAVLQRAFHPARGVAEVLQLILALAAPAAAKFAGLEMPTGDNALAYIGAAVVALVILRVFLVAPFQVWREQVGEIGGLKLELSEPERREMAHMAIIRAEKRLELAAAIREFDWTTYIATGKEGDAAIEARYGRMVALMGQAGVPQSFTTMVSKFVEACDAATKARASGNKTSGEGPRVFEYIVCMTDFLHGRLNAEELALRLIEKSEEPELPLVDPAEPTGASAPPVN